MGGVFNNGNLDLYCYSLNNPVKYFDPDGNVTLLNVGEESILKIRNAAVKAMEDPEYQQGGGGHRNAALPGRTWCNQALFDIVQEVLGDLSRFTLARGGRDQTRANDAVVKMIGEAIKGNLKMVDAKTAQKLANEGYLVVAGAMSKEVDSKGILKSGHVAVVAPSDIRQYDDEKGPMVYHIG
ncbi:MAG: hypothetical protein WHV26_15130, partial [Spirochaetota bacterium]